MPEYRNPSDEVDEYIKKFKKGNLDPKKKKKKMLRWLNKCENIKAFLMEEYDYSESKYGTLMKIKSDYDMKKKTKEELEDPEEQVRTEETSDFSDFITEAWNDARDIGLKVVRKYRNRAAELGFYNEEEDRVEIGRFVESALDFYITNAPKLDELRNENLANSVLVQVLKDQIEIQQTNMIKTSAILHSITKQNPQLKQPLSPAIKLLPDIPEQALQGGGQPAKQQQAE